MYLVINLTVADMFVGGAATFAVVFHFLLYGCEVGNKFRFRSKQFLTLQEWQPFLVLLMIDIWFTLTSVAGIAVISLDRMHATFRPFMQASQHQKMGLRGSIWWSLDFNCNVNSLSVNTSAWKIALVLMAVISLPLPFCYFYFLHLNCFKILVWNPSSFPWCSQ